MTDPALTADHDAAAWAPPYFWLVFLGVGAAVAFVVLSPYADGHGHATGFSAGLAMWFVTMFLGAVSAVVGGILTAFRKTRLFGTALLSAGAGGLLGAVLFMSMN